MATADYDLEEVELREWMESFEYVLRKQSPHLAQRILEALHERAQEVGLKTHFLLNSPYLNTISPLQQPPYPGSREIERRIKSIIRWNAMAMVVRANREEDGIGGHISTFASAATLYEVGFNHFFRAHAKDEPGDQVYFQGHAAPGIYARAYLEGRIDETHLVNFRRERRQGGGLSSYPHPWLMPDFWEFPTVSMGLGPIMAIYQARFNKYLENRQILKRTGKVWCFVGDGETDEPETLGAITLAAREKLDNLVFVVNCNLQRLDGPVRGNGKIIQELEAIFRGAGWNVIKVIWGSAWDELLAKDEEGLLAKRMLEAVDGDFQKYSVESGAYVREHFFGVHPELLKMVEHLSDEQIERLNRGGHDPAKVYAAFDAAVRHQGAPTVILAKTIKGYGLGESGEGKNITHQQKKLNEEELRDFRSRFGIPISDAEVGEAPFYRPEASSRETQYLHERRQALGGYLPKREVRAAPLSPLEDGVFEEFFRGTGSRPVSTTMAFVHMLSKLMRHPQIGRLVVPIVPDEARTFGMEALFRQFGIYSSLGQLYEPVDKDTLLYYREAKDGQILEEGITEAGSMCSFIAAGTAYATHGVNAIPFFIFYSMFGPQRVGDLLWAAGDIRARGFLLGGTAGRTTLAGEGLQHQDGHSHLLVHSHPTLRAYDPAFAYEIAVIVREGINRMYAEGKNEFYYLTLANEPYPMPPMPQGVEEGILKGMYLFSSADRFSGQARVGKRVSLLGSGAILNEVLAAQELLARDFGVTADVFSVTSYKELHREALACERENLLHPGAPAKVPYVTQCLSSPGVVVAVSDYVKALAESISRFVPAPFFSLGTDGFGRSESRAALRDFFEVDRRWIALAALHLLCREGDVGEEVVRQAMQNFGIDASKPNPVSV